jgi:hypothetical protein
MKGEVLEANTTWRGNPAKAVRSAAAPRQSPEVVLPAAA